TRRGRRSASRRRAFGGRSLRFDAGNPGGLLRLLSLRRDVREVDLTVLVGPLVHLLRLGGPRGREKPHESEGDRHPEMPSGHASSPLVSARFIAQSPAASEPTTPQLSIVIKGPPVRHMWQLSAWGLPARARSF